MSFQVTKNFAGIDYIRFDTIDYRYQIFVTDLGIDERKIKMVSSECGTCPAVKYIEREYFNKLMIQYVR